MAAISGKAAITAASAAGLSTRRVDPREGDYEVHPEVRRAVVVSLAASRETDRRPAHRRQVRRVTRVVRRRRAAGSARRPDAAGGALLRATRGIARHGVHVSGYLR